MKRLIIILVVVFGCLSARGQQRLYNNTLQATFQPTDLGVGIMYAHKFDNGLHPAKNRFKGDVEEYLNHMVFGYYVSASKGKYRMGEDEDGLYYINDHYKIAMGLSVRSSDYVSFFSVGLTRHWYGERKLMPSFNPVALDPYSFEFGVGADIKWIRAGFRFDPIKWEGCFDLGINF